MCYPNFIFKLAVNHADALCCACVCVHVWLDDGSSSFVHMSSAVGIVALHTTPNSYALTKICLNKIKNCIYLCFICNTLYTYIVFILPHWGMGQLCFILLARLVLIFRPLWAAMTKMYTKWSVSVQTPQILRIRIRIRIYLLASRNLLWDILRLPSSRRAALGLYVILTL